MSKAFTKEESPTDPVIVPERAPLPPGVPNYVTERGMRLLEEERRQLVAERARLSAAASDLDEGADERAQQLAVLNQRLRDLTGRIATAQLVTPRAKSDRTVRFGATVTLRTAPPDAKGETLRIKLVGVDEAGMSPDLVAFCAPIAKAILGHEEGERVARQTRAGEEYLDIVDVSYEAAEEAL